VSLITKKRKRNYYNSDRNCHKTCHFCFITEKFFQKGKSK